MDIGKRLREANHSAQQPSGNVHMKTTCGGHGGHHWNLTSARSARPDFPDSLDLLPCLTKLSPASVVSGRVSTGASLFGHVTTISPELSPSMTVFSAMYVSSPCPQSPCNETNFSANENPSCGHSSSFPLFITLRSQ
jgi:hypothetical protein